MSNYTEIASKMEENSICKAGIGNYIIYRRDFLFENFENEMILLKSAKEYYEKFGRGRARNIIDELRSETAAGDNEID